MDPGVIQDHHGSNCAETPVFPMSTSQSTQNMELQKVILLRFLARKRVSYNFLNFRLEDRDITNNMRTASGSQEFKQEPHVFEIKTLRLLRQQF